MTPEVLCSKIAGYLATGYKEHAVDCLNALGTYLAEAGDHRAILCFHQALTLTCSPGRRVQTLARIADFHALVLSDRARARRYYRQAIRAADHAACDPQWSEALHDRILELEADAAGRSLVLTDLRRRIGERRLERKEAIAALRIPETLEGWGLSS